MFFMVSDLAYIDVVQKPFKISNNNQLFKKNKKHPIVSVRVYLRNRVVWLPLIETRCSFIWMSLLLMMLLHLKKSSCSSTDLQIRQHVCGQYRLTELCNVAEEFHDDEECSVFNALCLQKRPPSVQQKEWGMGCLWVRICRLFLEGRIIRERSDQRPVQHYCV